MKKSILIVLLSLTSCIIFAQENRSFKDYVSHFREKQLPCGMNVDSVWSYFPQRASKGSPYVNYNIPAEYIKQYICPSGQKCDCSNTKEWYLYGIKMNLGKYVAVVVSKRYDNYPTKFGIGLRNCQLIVYNGEGRMISQKTIAQDSFQHFFFGKFSKGSESGSLLSLSIERGSMLEYTDRSNSVFKGILDSYVYTVDEQGLIKETKTASKAAKVQWTEKKIKILETGDLVPEQEAENLISKFYKAYISESGSLTGDELKKKYLTKRLIEKLDRVRAETDADAIIRAQDTTDDMVKSLSVKRIEGDWYMVSYTSGKGTKFEKHEEIPMKVIRSGNGYMIDYITPSWNTIRYGGTMLEESTSLPINTSSPYAFLDSFYRVYTLMYATMPDGLTARLATLRAKYLTPKALLQFKEVEKKVKSSEGSPNYDMLIDGFDYDPGWELTVVRNSLKDGVLKCIYKRNPKSEKFNSFRVKVVKQGTNYMIDGIIMK
jgi:hypothetical protein